MIDFDIILEKLGGVGRIQVALFFIICYSAILSGINTIAPLFINEVPDYRCNASPLDTNFSLTEEEILNYTTPVDENGDYDYCYRYNYTLENCNLEDNLACVDMSAEPIKCDNGFYFDRSIYSENVITEFNLVCDQSYLNFLATSLSLLGVLFGSAIFGWVSDRFGRKVTFIICAACTLGALIGNIFVHNITLFIVCRFFTALFGYGIFITCFVYLTEIVPKQYIAFVGVGYQVFFAVGYMILSGIAYAWRNWHDVLAVNTILCAPYAIFIFVIPESPRWLFSNNKDKQGRKVTRMFAKWNGVQLDEKEIWKQADVVEVKKEEDDEKVYGISDLFKTPRMRLMTINVIFNWFVNSMIYYGVSLNAGSLSGDVFVNNAINGAVEIGSYIVLLFTMDTLGRKIMLIFNLALAGLAMVAVAVIGLVDDPDEPTLGTVSQVISFIAKFGTAASFAVIYNLTVELFPTVVRSNAVGISSALARIGSALAPLLLAFPTWLSNFIFGGLAIIAALASLAFPETKGREMMESIEEAEAFYGGVEKTTRSDEIQMTEKANGHKAGVDNRGFSE